MPDEIASLIAALQSNDPSRQLFAAEKLAQLGTDAQPAAVALVAACACTENVRDWATSALEGLGSPQESDIKPLISFLRHTSQDAAYWAVTLLGRLGGAGAEAVPELTRIIEGRHEPELRRRAAWALGKIGAPAAAARGVLQVAAQSSDPRLAALAREAIAEIGS